MKIKLTLTIMVVLAAFCRIYAQGPQVPNGNFAAWDTIVLVPADTTTTDTSTVITPAVIYLVPDQWTTVDGLAGGPIGITFQDSTDVPVGSAYSLELLVDTLPGESLGGTVVGFAAAGGGDNNGSGYDLPGIPFLFRPDTLFFDYQYTSPGNDTAGMFINLWNSTDSGILGSTVGAEVDVDTTSTWTTVTVVLTPYYLNSDVPDTLQLQFYASLAQNPVIGSILHIDNLRFGYATTLSEVATAIGPTTFCAGDSVLLSAPASSPDYIYYQWYAGDYTQPISGANTSFLGVYASGSYYVLIDSAGVPAYSDTITVNVDAGTQPTLIAVSGSDTNSFCYPSNPIQLVGSPAGGLFIGTGVVDSVYVPYNTGTFVLNYVYSDSLGCSGIANDTITENVCTGIAPNSAMVNLEVYPNPTSGNLNITCDKDLTGCAMRLYNIVGQMVAGSTLQGFTNNISVSGVANGTYVLKIVDKQGALVGETRVDVMK